MDVSGNRPVQLEIGGMTCASCASRIEKAVGKMAGVERIQVNLAVHRAAVLFDRRLVTLEQIEQKISKLGFQAKPVEIGARREERQSEVRHLGLRALLSAILTVPFIWSMAKHHPLTSNLWVPEVLLNPWLQLTLAAVVQFAIGLPFYERAFAALRNKSANMELLVVLGSSAAFLYSHYLIFRMPAPAPHAGMHSGMHAEHPMLYFDTSTMIITIVWAGKWLEALARQRTGQSIGQLRRLQLPSARVIRHGEQHTVLLEEVRAGDTVAVYPGELIPVDGVLTEGSAAVDESAVTGEGMPVDKSPGSYLYSGTLNQNGVIYMRADKVGEDAAIGRMARLVEEAQASKAPIQRLADRWAGVFVPVIVAAAALTFAVWWLLEPGNVSGAIEKAIAVVLIACPCALGVATPTSILVASGRAAETGILFKEGKHLELLARSDVVVIDKTGTLTLGRPQVTDWIGPIASYTAHLRLAGAAAAPSRHPYARAIVNAALQRKLNLPECREFGQHPGQGVEAVVEGRRVAVGSLNWFRKLGIGCPVSPAQLERLLQGGRSLLCVAVDGVWAGAAVLEDPVKGSSRKAVDALRRLGLEVVMATGDRTETAHTIAGRVGISRVYAELLPEAKADLVRRLQREGKKVAMVGDGINDAAALAAADTGIAIRSGTDIAKSAADVVLMKSDLHAAVQSVRLSRSTMRNIRQNLLMSLGYNAVAIPFAVTGYLAPWMACTAMALSSVTVICNALRLRKA
ncbi:heavy metal translocating P-type ATPase [Paenibacillus hamazuiensis]|uniref:heavy metal translocating P-type ATPase n=1 Tax=Paenibacillus hamazuiensis TaxID=2936508 RepID=UPI00200F5EED|nr:heavy metal translocating P-type ATPase [Paenibacillus hamazuiensis]